MPQETISSKTIEEIKEELGERKERCSDDLDRTIDDFLGRLIYYGHINNSECPFVMSYYICTIEDYE